MRFYFYLRSSNKKAHKYKSFLKKNFFFSLMHKCSLEWKEMRWTVLFIRFIFNDFTWWRLTFPSNELNWTSILFHIGLLLRGKTSRIFQFFCGDIFWLVVLALILIAICKKKNININHICTILMGVSAAYVYFGVLLGCGFLGWNAPWFKWCPKPNANLT